MNRSIPRAAAALSFVLVGLACTVLNPLGEYGPPVARAGDAASDSAIDGAAAPCSKARWPARPTANDDTATDPGDVVFALQTISFGNPSDSGIQEAAGYDLDGVCTCPGPPSCIGPAGVVLCDSDGGIDSSGSDLFQRFIEVGGSTRDINAQLAAGERGQLFRLRNWNGGLDDVRVDLETFSSAGTEGVEKKAPTPPAWDGADRFTVDPASLAGGGNAGYQPLFADGNAYVSGGTLVATVDFPLNIFGFTIRLIGSVFTARIVREGAVYRLVDGRIAGRWATKTLLTGLDTIRDPTSADGGGLCGQSEIYKSLKSQICGVTDIVADYKQDNTSAPCDAVSITIVFAAAQAQLGRLFGDKPNIRRCGDGWVDDCPRQ